MQFTGSELTLKRNFFTQTGNYGFVMSAVVDNTTGQYRFGLTGGAGALEFTLNSGRLFYGSQFLHAYQSHQEMVIEGQFTSGGANILKDGAALAFGAPKGTGNYDYFYFTRANAGMAATFDVEISGNSIPLYAITSQGYLLTSGQQAVTGYFVNQSAFPLRVFDSSIQASQNYTFSKLATNLGGGATGTFAYSADFNSLDLSQPILTTFNTSYNDANILFTITDARTEGLFVYLTAPSDFSFNSTNILNRDLTYLNYSGGFVVGNYSTSLVFQLTYATGAETFTGVWDFATGANSNSLVSMLGQGFYSTGMISGSGIFAPNSQVTFQVTYSGLSGNASQLVLSGNNILNPISQLLTFNA